MSYVNTININLSHLIKKLSKVDKQLGAYNNVSVRISSNGVGDNLHLHLVNDETLLIICDARNCKLEGKVK